MGPETNPGERGKWNSEEVRGTWNKDSGIEGRNNCIGGPIHSVIVPTTGSCESSSEVVPVLEIMDLPVLLISYTYFVPPLFFYFGLLYPE